MVRLAFTLLSSQAEAEEVVQDAFAEVYMRWETLLNPGGYLRISVINRARRVLRRRIHRDELHQVIGDAQERTVAPTDYLLDTLDGLPERQRTAVVLAYYAQMTSAEIAEALECRVGTAKSLVHRGIKRLRKELVQ